MHKPISLIGVFTKFVHNKSFYFNFRMLDVETKRLQDIDDRKDKEPEFKSPNRSGSTGKKKNIVVPLF